MNKKEYQPLTIPKVSWDKKTLTKTYGELTVQPLEPGFGTTFGNVLRRTLLGGIEGSAVTSVIIDGVNNEFSTLPGVVEDVMQVILNIKEIVIGNSTGQPGKMTLSVKGKEVATVADIVADEHLELINQDLVLAHIAPGGSLTIEFFVEPGRGYQIAQWPQGQALQEDNRIYIDATFAPVRQVTFDVQKTRVGKSIDYDKLTVLVTTDGTVTPVDAVNYAISVVRNQLEHFLTSAEIPFNEMFGVAEQQPSVEDTQEKSGATINGISVDFLLKPIDVLEFSVRAHNCLISSGVKRIIDLVNMTEDEVQKIKNFGRKSFEEVKEGMKQFGLSFGMNIKESEAKKLQEKEA
jgi:DNA-directed RNA polymerase subunit alpha